MLRSACARHGLAVSSAVRCATHRSASTSASQSNPLIVGSGTELDDYKGNCFPWRHRVECAWGHMDALGHVNNVQYFQYFETARCGSFHDAGLDAFNGAVGPILASTSCAFKRPVVWPDELTVGLRVDGLDAPRGEFTQHYAVFSGAAQRVCAVGEAKIVLVHTAGEQAGRRAAVPQEWLDRFWPEGAP